MTTVLIVNEAIHANVMDYIFPIVKVPVLGVSTIRQDQLKKITRIVMAIPVTKTKPIWLAKQDANDMSLSYSYRRSIRYYQALYQAWPDWCSSHKGFKTINTIARVRRRSGEDVHIDHIVPICSKIVCGLHVPWNLQVISKEENYAKSNTQWPDCPNAQLSLFLTE